uniref:Uncharacterized protein n=1 Tax=Siphoviridae sp. ctZd434 TaxID=2825559 RepID=A0A8S5UHD8_9CAUD|nr:MAG TPA: hypothetical protein [Siphoviridae sp. ctZd434]
MNSDLKIEHKIRAIFITIRDKYSLFFTILHIRME